MIIIENADRMADSARNALLKILEEPPEDVVFILTTAKRGAVLPTILSRVRTYTFFERSAGHQQKVIERVFHYQPSFSEPEMPKSVASFLQTYLPVKPEYVSSYAKLFLHTLCGGHVPDIAQITAGCSGFDPRILFRIFMEAVIELQRPILFSPAGCAVSAMLMSEFRRTVNNVTVFNQNPVAALEELSRTVLHIHHENEGVLESLLAEEKS